MAGYSLGSAYIQVVPTTKGLPGAIEKGVGDGEKRASKSFGGRIWGALKKTAKVGAVAAGAAAGTAIVGGFKNAIDQQTNSAVLEGLYGNAEKAATTLTGLRQVAKESPIDYTSYQQAANSLAYAGVEGENATNILDKVGWAIVGAGGGATELDRAMDGLLKGVNNGGVVMNDTLGMISDSGYPIIDGLSEKFGTTGDVIKQMAADGEISIDDVLEVMENGTGELAQSQEKAGKQVAQTFGSQMTIMKDNIFTAIGDVLIPVLEKIAPAIEPVGDAIAGGIEKLPGIFAAVWDGAQKVWNILKPWAPLIGAIAGAFVLWNTTMAISNGLFAVQTFIKAGWLSITGAQIGAMTVLTAVQKGLNSAMRANPIGVIVTALMLLVAGVIMAYKNFEWFRNIVDGAWAGIKAAASAVVGWFQDTVWPTLKTVLGAIGDAAIWLYENAILPAWNGIKAAIGAVGTWITETLWPAIQTAWDAIGAAATWLYESIIQPVWTGIRIAIAIAVTAIQTYIDLLKWYFDSVIAPVAMWLWESVFKPAWDGIKRAIGSVIDWVRNVGWPALKSVFNLIGDIAVWLYQSALKPAWDGIRRAISAVVTWFRDTAWPLVRTVIEWLGQRFEEFKIALGIVWDFIRNRVINPVVRWFQNTVWPLVRKVLDWLEMAFEGWKIALRNIWNFIRNRVINPVVTWFRDTVWPIFSRAIGQIRDRFTWFRDRLKATWDNLKNRVVKPVVDWFTGTVKPKFDTFTDNVKSAFNTLKDNVLKAWDGIKDGMKEPINGVIGIYNDHIAGNFNKVIDTLFSKDDAKKYRLAEMDTFATGGYTGPGSKYQPAGVVHADEYVIRKESQQSLRRSAPGFLDDLNRHGAGALGYASGGLVKFRYPFNGTYPRGEGFGARGGSHQGVDWPMPHGASLVAVAPGTANRTRNSAAGNKLELRIGDGLVAGYHHLSSFGIAQGATAAAGDTIGRVGSTGRSTGPHLHFSLKKDGTYVDPMPYLGAGGAAGDGDGGGGWNPLANLWDDVKDKIASAAGGGSLGPMLVQAAEGTVGGMVDWVTGKIAEIGDWAVETGKEVAGTAGVTARWGLLGTRALAMTGDTGPMVHASMMRRINQESGGDKNAINDWDCLTLDARIFTRRGWLSYNEVRIGDETIGFNPETGKSEWTTITRVVQYDDADVVTLGNSRWAARGTLNHKWISEPRETIRLGGFEGDECSLCEWPNGARRSGKTTQGGLAIHMAKAHGIKADLELVDSYGDPRFVQTGEINSRDRIVLSKPAETGEGLPISAAEAEILGWVAGDGHVETREHRPTWTISQVKPDMVEKLRVLLADVPHVEYEYATNYERAVGDVSAHFRLDYEWVQDLRHRSGHPVGDVESLVMQMSAPQRSAWLRGMIDAEATINKDGKPIVYQNAGPVLDALVLAFYLEGRRPRVNAGKVGHETWADSFVVVGNIPHVAGGSLSVTEPGVEDVWCVTTELGSWTAQQGEHVFLTGNSNARRGTPSKGLMQVIQPTFNAHRDSRAPNDIWDPLANMLAAIHYTKSRYSSLRAGWDQAGGYAMGGLVKPFLHDRGGWHMPDSLSINQTRKPEAVLTDAQWSTMHSLAEQNLSGSAGGVVVHGGVHGYSAGEVAVEIEKRRRRRESLYSRV